MQEVDRTIIVLMKPTPRKEGVNFYSIVLKCWVYGMIVLPKYFFEKI